MGVLISYALPIVPGQEDRVRRLRDEMGPHIEEFERLNKEATVTRFWSYLQETPMGNLAIYTMEVDDPSRIRPLVDAGTPYDEWWLDFTRDVHGMNLRNITPEQRPASPVPVFMWPAT
jgi:hypothetical protein